MPAAACNAPSFRIVAKVRLQMTEWALVPGEKIKRTELHRLFGGSG